MSAGLKQAAADTRRWVGQSPPRGEDRRLLLGRGRFADDMSMSRMGYVHFVRSPHAHARIVAVDTSAVEAIEGVFATLTGAEVKELTDPFFQIAPPPGGRLEEFCLAVDKARYHGDAVAAVMADSRELARDAAELVEVEYELLPAVLEAVAALDPSSPVLHDAADVNVVWHGVYDYGDVDSALQTADHLVKIDRLHFHRFSSTPLECSGALVNWDPGTDVIEIRSNNQMPMFASMMLSPSLRVGVDQLDWRSQDIGGGFGIKIASYPQITALALLSRKAGRPAKWTETRAEHMLSAGHGGERTFLDINVPVTDDGTILGFKLRAIDDAGAYLRHEPLGCVVWSQVLAGCYRFKHIHVDYTQVLTNKCPTVPNRGYSRMQHLWAIERIVDTVGRRLGFNPVEIRKRNYVRADDYPYETPNGCVYDSGNLFDGLDKALELIDYDGWRRRQVEGSPGRRIGIGIGSTLDSGTNSEAAICKLDLHGEIGVVLGTTPQGQGHETTAAQVVADMLDVEPARVRVRAGFNKEHGAYVGFSGTYASQFAVTGIGAVVGAAGKLRDEIVRLAAFALQAEEHQIALHDGAARVCDDSGREISFMGIANLVYANVASLPAELADSVSLNCRHVWRPPFESPDPESKRGNLTLTYASQIHACVVEIDEETGQVEVLDYAAVDDCGTRIHPKVVEGQVHGAAGLGIAAALQESLDYDAEGRLLQPTFQGYWPATALDIPRLKTAFTVSPSPFSEIGSKGMGEGGGAPLATLSSAIQDAIGRNALVTDTHNPPERVYRLLRAARDGEVAVR